MNLLTQRLSCLPRSHQSSDLVTSPVLYLNQLHASGSPCVSETPLPLLQTVTENLVLGIPGSSGEEVGEHPGTCCGGDRHRSKVSLSPTLCGMTAPALWLPVVLLIYLGTGKISQRSNGHRVKSAITNSYCVKCNFIFPKSVYFYSGENNFAPFR